MIRINELMDVLGSANDALNRLPQAEAEVTRLKRALEASQAEANRYRQASEDIGVELDKARAHATTIGSERDEAQFRTLELEEKLHTISKALGSALSLVEPAPVGEVKTPTEPEPLVEAASQNPTPPEDEPSTDLSDYAPRAYNYEAENARFEQRNTYIPTSAPEVAAEPSHPEQGQNQNPTPTPNAEPSPQAPAASTPEVPSTAPTSDYTGWGWRSKPNNVTWKDFISAGGERPYWMDTQAASYANYA